MKKVNKEFTLGDSTVNTYGFRLLTSGYMIDEFLKNPIGYYMHKREDGVVVRWDEVSIKGDRITGKPIINTDNTKGEQVYNEVLNGFLNAASFGQIVVIEQSDDPNLKLPGQTGPTITKWYNRECSLVDVPGNMNAVCLYDKNGELINLTSFLNHNNSVKHQQNGLLIELMAKSWNELDKSGKLEDLKALDKNVFFDKFEEAFGKKHNGDKRIVEIKSPDLVEVNSSDSIEERVKKINAETERLNNRTVEEKAFDRILNPAHQRELESTKNHKLKVSSVKEQLGKAFKEKTINESQLIELKKLYKPEYVYELQMRLVELAQERSLFLESLSWKQLDENDLIEELKIRDFNAFREKYREAFGKYYMGETPKGYTTDTQEIQN